MQRRRRLISWVVFSVSMLTSLAYYVRPSMRLTGPAAFPQLSQKFARMDEERVLLEDSRRY